MKVKLMCLVVLFLFALSGPVGAQELVLAVGPGGSDMAAMGSALAAILTGKTTTVRAVESAGDSESIARVVSGAADLAVVDSLSAYEAALGIGRFGPTNKAGAPAAAVVGLSVEHFLLVAPAENAADIGALSGKILYLGPDSDPGTHAAATILNASGIESFFEVGNDWDYDTAAELLIDGTFDGAVFSGAVPLDAVSHLVSTMGAHIILLGISNEKLVRIRDRWPIWFPYVVAGGSYPGIEKPYETIARPILLLAAEALENTTVESLLSGLFENPGVTPPVGLPAFPTESMTRTYCPIRIHPGAADYFRERGF